MERLRFEERLVIEQEVAKGTGIRAIGRILGREHLVISRELKPSQDQGFLPYSARRAQLRAERRAKVTNKRELDKDRVLREFVVEKLTEDWSPEQIVGRLMEFPPVGLTGRSLVPETIYQFVYSLERGSDGKLLYHHLRRSQPKRIRRYSRRPSKIKIPERVSIHQRPALVGHGHWETDTLFGRKNQPVSVQYEKKSQLLRLHKLSDQTANTTLVAIIDSLRGLPNSWQRTMTFDNGSENYQHLQLRAFGLATYFCDAYCAWQKGGVENINGLVRQYIPKRTDLTEYSDEHIWQIQERINNRPRKGLNYRTPNEILAKVVH